MFFHNSTIHSATKFQPYHLVYGHPVVIPTSMKNDPELQYNYNDYQYEIKKQMQESEAIARKNLLNAKEKSKEHYDRNSKQQSFSIGDKVLMLDKTSKNKLAPKWFGSFDIFDIDPIWKKVVVKKRGKRLGRDYSSKPIKTISTITTANLCFRRMILQNLLPALITIQSIRAQTFKIENFNSHQGLYYQNEGQVRLSNVN
ncbi:Hypothetical protein CINCED_3A002846 [Cinara cedri]|uniref:Uncharacterized protein n=1 Tax=Cinara cedri TaxID=506608 RepID=A0A5E4MS56_9HEMI|nr:Hypothetical protein CINCED_3A002846 [Cinara cedri]